MYQQLMDDCLKHIAALEDYYISVACHLAVLFLTCVLRLLLFRLNLALIKDNKLRQTQFNVYCINSCCPGYEFKLGLLFRSSTVLR